MEYELKLDDLLKSLTELGIDTDKLTIVEKSEKFDEQEFINDYRNSIDKFFIWYIASIEKYITDKPYLNKQFKYFI